MKAGKNSILGVKGKDGRDKQWHQAEARNIIFRARLREEKGPM